MHIHTEYRTVAPSRLSWSDSVTRMLPELLQGLFVDKVIASMLDPGSPGLTFLLLRPGNFEPLPFHIRTHSYKHVAEPSRAS